MKDLNPSQWSRVNTADPRIADLFRHVRAAVDILEDLTGSYFCTEKSVAAQIPITHPGTVELKKLAYNIREVAELLGIPRSAVYRAVHENKLPSIRFGHRFLVPAAALQARIAAPLSVPADPNG